MREEGGGEESSRRSGVVPSDGGSGFEETLNLSRFIAKERALRVETQKTVED